MAGGRGSRHGPNCGKLPISDGRPITLSGDFATCCPSVQFAKRCDGCLWRKVASWLRRANHGCVPCPCFHACDFQSDRHALCSGLSPSPCVCADDVLVCTRVLSAGSFASIQFVGSIQVKYGSRFSVAHGACCPWQVSHRAHPDMEFHNLFAQSQRPPPLKPPPCAPLTACTARCGRFR